MDLFTRLLLRAAIWVRRPPSSRHVAVVAVALAIGGALAAIEHFFGWPDWATVSPHGFRGTPIPPPR
jgi:hypothetical protein